MERKIPGGGTAAALTPGADRPHPGQPWQRREGEEAGAALPLRASPRRPARLEAVVNHGLSYSAVWHLRSLSLDGAFLEKTGVQDLPLGVQVELVLRVRYKGEPLELRLPARVVRLTAEGAAVRFGRYDDETYTHLVNLLYA